jgi:hypothetical protein
MMGLCSALAPGFRDQKVAVMGLIPQFFPSGVTIDCRRDYYFELEHHGGVRGVRKVQMSRTDGGRSFPTPCRGEPCILKRHERGLRRYFEASIYDVIITLLTAVALLKIGSTGGY